LSFPGGGERIAAVLGGNADLIMGQVPELIEQVRAGKLRVIAAMGPSRLVVFPDVPTLAEQGFNVQIPESHRGIMGPGGMPADAATAYETLFKRLHETETWKQYTVKNGFGQVFRPGAEFGAYLERESSMLDKLLGELGMKAQ
jgi:putative tricarboxylic transport membrane protein